MKDPEAARTKFSGRPGPLQIWPGFYPKVRRCLIRLTPGLFLMVIVACGRSSPSTYTDPRMQQAFDAGRGAYDLGYLSQSGKLYALAYTRARAVNDRAGLVSAGYNLAVISLKAHQPDRALEWVGTTTRDIGARGLRPPQKLLLTQAVAYYQLQDWSRAAAIACQISDTGSTVGLRAKFFCGMSAVAQGRTDFAMRELLDLQRTAAPMPRLQADRFSLQARIAYATGHDAESLTASQKAVEAARQAGDDAAMRDMLALASASAARLGQAGLSHALSLQMTQSADASAATAR